MIKRKDKLSVYLVIGVITVVVLWLLVPYLVIRIYGAPDGPGTLGDTFGIVNALFTSLAFAFLIYTSLMQREELELQRNELELTRKELEKSALAQEHLVRLTTEQLELERHIRRKEIKPEIGFENLRLHNGPDRFMCELAMKVRHNRIKIIQSDILDDNTGFSLERTWEETKFNKYLDPGEGFPIVIERKQRFVFEEISVKIRLVFMDIDDHEYEQQIVISRNKIMVGSVQPISPVPPITIY